MKLFKLASLAVIGAVAALGAYNVVGAEFVGITTNYSQLKISGTITTNTPYISHGSSWKHPTRRAKFGNKQLLELFADWAGADRTTDPWKHASLVIGWDHGSDVLVVDKTRTNILFDASQGVTVGGTNAYFYVDFWNEYGAGYSKGKDANPGYYAATDTGTAYYELYDGGVSLAHTDLNGYGGNMQKFKQSWDKNGNPTKWSDSESAKFLYSGHQYFQAGSSDTTSTANIKASGKGKGYNYIGWAD